MGDDLPIEAEGEYALRSGGRALIYPQGKQEAGYLSAMVKSAGAGHGCGLKRTRTGYATLRGEYD